MSFMDETPDILLTYKRSLYPSWINPCKNGDKQCRCNRCLRYQDFRKLLMDYIGFKHRDPTLPSHSKTCDCFGCFRMVAVSAYHFLQRKHRPGYMDIPSYSPQPPYPNIFQKKYRVQGRYKETVFAPSCSRPSYRDCDCQTCIYSFYSRTEGGMSNTPAKSTMDPEAVRATQQATTPEPLDNEVTPTPEPPTPSPATPIQRTSVTEDAPLTSTPKPVTNVPAMELALPEDIQPLQAEGHPEDCNCTPCLSQLLKEAQAITENEPSSDLNLAASEGPAQQPHPPVAQPKQLVNFQMAAVEATDNLPVPVQPAQPQLPKFKLPAATGTATYAAVAAMAAAKPDLNFTARPNLQGDIIITPKDQATASLFHKETTLTFLDPTKKQRKAVVYNYPSRLPVSLIAECQNVAQAKRRLGRGKAPTKEVNVTFIGPIPPNLELGPWGTFPIKALEKEPLRCFNCQRFGHHKTHFRSRAVCGVCSGSHPTQTCIDAHNDGNETQAKCPNCSKNHHAWNKRCPEFLRRLQLQQDSNPVSGPPTTEEPKPQRKPRRRPPRRPAQTSTPAVNQEPNITASPAEEPPAGSDQPPPHAPVISSILSQTEALPIDTLIPLVLQLGDSIKLNDGLQIPPISPISSPPSTHSSEDSDSEINLEINLDSSVHENSECSENESENDSEIKVAYSESKTKVPPRIGRANSKTTPSNKEENRNNSNENNRPKVRNNSSIGGNSENNANNIRSNSASVRPKTQYKGNTVNNNSDNNSDSASAGAGASASEGASLSAGAGAGASVSVGTRERASERVRSKTQYKGNTVNNNSDNNSDSASAGAGASASEGASLSAGAGASVSVGASASEGGSLSVGAGASESVSVGASERARLSVRPKTHYRGNTINNINNSDGAGAGASASAGASESAIVGASAAKSVSDRAKTQCSAKNMHKTSAISNNSGKNGKTGQENTVNISDDNNGNMSIEDIFASQEKSGEGDGFTIVESKRKRNKNSGEKSETNSLPQNLTVFRSPVPKDPKDPSKSAYSLIEYTETKYPHIKLSVRHKPNGDLIVHPLDKEAEATI
ncbi:uncharacterized protein [Palaemon carinicauda]|uniref:uncharacterized protein n=1 Tax=Palaemon carinicauda TaxID=392227 RepID=UPI0035B59F9F